MKKIFNWAIQGTEFLLAALFIWGGIGVLSQPKVNTDIQALEPLLGEAALIGYTIFFIALGLALIYGKLFHLRRIHGYALAGMFLTTIYAIILNAMLYGWQLSAITNIIIALVILALYIRWRYKVIFDKLD